MEELQSILVFKGVNTELGSDFTSSISYYQYMIIQYSNEVGCPVLANTI